MIVRKIADTDVCDASALDRAFSELPPEPIACCNWAEKFPYTPGVVFRMFHTGAFLALRFDVAERYTAARINCDNGEVWTDSCVEFFIAPDRESYYNFETNCIGRMLLGFKRPETDEQHAAPQTLGTVRRIPTLPVAPFAEREGDNRWSMTLLIPPQALFGHRIDDWSGLEARANLYKCGDKLSHPHFLSWRPIESERPDFHRPEFFDTMKFADR